MIDEVILRIKQDKVLYNYLKYHSYWYIKIKRNNNKVYEMIEEMKKELKLTKEDKLEDLKEKIELISAFLDVLT